MTSAAAQDRSELLFIVDAGTQSIRSSLVDLEGNIQRLVRVPIEPYFSAQPGWAEQHPDYYWEKLCESSQLLLRESGVDPDRILAAAVTTLRSSVINLDEDGRPLRPAILWIDQRLADVEGWPPAWMRLPMRAVGLYRRLADLIRNCEANWIRQNQPEIWERTHKFLLLSGFFHFKLTGEYTESVGNNMGYLPFDTKTFRWAGRQSLVWKLFPIERHKLPALVQPTEPIGRVTEEASRQTGLPRGLVVIAAAADKACEILGSGCRTPETACLSYGTMATVGTATPRHVRLKPLLPPYPAAVPGEYHTEVSIMRGYWLVRWFKEELGFREKLLAEERNVAPEMLFDEMIRPVPPGSMGLVLQPYWSPGIFTDCEAKGTITGFGEIHKRAHLYRSILEGLTYALKEGAMLIEKKNGVALESLRVSGGGSQSPTVMQITADVFGLPASRPHTYETSTLGAAIVAAVGLKLYDGFDGALKAMTRARDRFEPIPENSRIYQEIFHRVYRKMYRKVRPLLKEIQEITGYPEDPSGADSRRRKLEAFQAGSSARFASRTQGTQDEPEP